MALFSKPISYQELFIRLFYNNLQRKQIISVSGLIIAYLLIRLRKVENSSISQKDLLHHRKKGPLDLGFFKKLFRISQIIAPSIRSREDSTEIVIFTLVLLSRTVLTLYLADINGKIVKSLVNHSFLGFLTKLFNLALCAIPASFLNNYIEYMKQRITLNVRTKLVQYAMEKYFSSLCFYDMTFLNNHNHMDVVDTFTEDIYSWAHSFSDILCNAIKNSFDILFFTFKIAQDFGWKGPTAIMLWYLFSGCVLRLMSPPLRSMTSRVRNLEYEYKELYENINENAEQLAFYRRNTRQTEKERISRAFESIKILHLKITIRKAVLTVFEVLLHKFGTVISAYLLLGLPVFGRLKEQYLKKIDHDPSMILRDLAANSFILLNLRKSFNRFLITLRELFSLSGHTNYVVDGVSRIEDLSSEEGRIRRFFPNLKIDPHNLPNLQVIEDGDDIKLGNVEILGPPPENRSLISCLDCEIKPGMNTMFTGPEGSGKTALFRVLTGLWPIKEGKLRRPKKERIAYASHRVYFPPGNLRDQIIYPDTPRQMKKKDRKDEDLQRILEEIGLHYLVDKIGGFEALEDWNEILDAPEKQALLIARVVYHRPLYVILDECIHFNEAETFKVLRKEGITALTVSHRASLSKYHGYLMRFDGEEGWSFEKFKLGKKK